MMLSLDVLCRIARQQFYFHFANRLLIVMNYTYAEPSFILSKSTLNKISRKQLPETLNEFHCNTPNLRFPFCIFFFWIYLLLCLVEWNLMLTEGNVNRTNWNSKSICTLYTLLRKNIHIGSYIPGGPILWEIGNGSIFMYHRCIQNSNFWNQIIIIINQMNDWFLDLWIFHEKFSFCIEIMLNNLQILAQSSDRPAVLISNSIRFVIRELVQF